MSTPHKPHSLAFPAIVNEATSRVKELDIDQSNAAPPAGHGSIDTGPDNPWAPRHLAARAHMSNGTTRRAVANAIPESSAKPSSCAG